MAAPANRQDPAGHHEHVHLAPRQNSEYFFFEGLGGYFMLCGCSSKRQWSGSPSLQPYGPTPAVEEGQEGQAVTEQVTSTWNHRPARNSASRAGNRLHCTAGPTRQPAPPPLPAPDRARGLRSRRRGARCLGVGGLQVLALSPHRTARAPLPGGRTLVPALHSARALF